MRKERHNPPSRITHRRAKNSDDLVQVLVNLPAIPCPCVPGL